MLDKKSLIEERVNTGLRGQWYPVAKSVEVKATKPYGAVVLGEKLVLWRDGSGAIKCIEDFCPHRGAPLSYGEIHEGNIGCRYHGVILDGEGVVKRVPAMPECALEGRKALNHFSTAESSDCVFVYIPSVERPEAPELVMPADLTSGEWASFLCTAVWDCNYRYALDNLADPMHGCYLHSESFTLAFGSKQDLMELNKTDDGFRIQRVSQTGANFDWTEFEVYPSNMFCFLDIPYPAPAGPGGVMRIVGYVLPVTATTCKVFFWRMRKVEGLARESWRFLYRARLEENHWAVLEQDRVMLEGMPDDARKREMLYQHDLGISRIRQILTRAAKQQIEAEVAAVAAQ
jgi:phenylpropionate dioxygenase-like ring-hydroxylating dioxygenase large terminal subunit